MSKCAARTARSSCSICKSVTPRERLFAALRGEPTDHVPVWLLFPHDRAPYYADVHALEAYRPVCEMIPQKAVTLNRRGFDLPLYGADVKCWREELSGGVRRNWVEGPGGVKLYNEHGKKALLETDEDLEAWASLPFANEDEITAALEKQLDAYMAEKRAFPQELGAMMLDLGEPIGPIYYGSNLESFSIWSLTRHDVVKGVLEKLMARCRVVYQKCLERELAETYFLVGSELAAPPLVGRAAFQSWIVPYAKEVVAMARSAGVFAVQHFHGHIRGVLDGFVEMAPHALHTIEAPPVGNCTFTQAYGAVGKNITLIGNIQYDEFRSRTPDEMRRAVRAVLEECRGRRLVLSPTAGPFDSNPPRRIIENYCAILDEAWRFGEWKIEN